MSGKLYYNKKKFNNFIEVLYKNPNISHGNLASLLNASVSSLSSRVKKYSQVEPPLFEKTLESKYCYYSLTEDGKKYYLENIDNLNEVENQIKESLISYILCATEQNQNPYVLLLKQIDISDIARTFTTEEFLFLSINL